jgi:hypothetical protein
MKAEQTECSETSKQKIHAQGNHPKERIQHSQKGKSFKSRIIQFIVQRQALRLVMVDRSKRRMDKYSNILLQLISTHVVSDTIKK